MPLTSPPTPSPTPLSVQWRLSTHARSAGRVRKLLRERAVVWRLPEEATESAELLLTELVTNAYRHARAPRGREIWVRCTLDGGRLRIEVSDAGDTFPVPQQPDLDGESGRGLTLVAALSADWGADPRPCGIGKTVWCELLV
ncbi:ATP-binding protein [Streptomyces sp. NPDC058045]|uniref:ATP-binding protein n=1 Tax=Streptomyces sp. NPDC058045 TaxID=3346311 RepID=UPI0036E6B829